MNRIFQITLIIGSLSGAIFAAPINHIAVDFSQLQLSDYFSLGVTPRAANVMGSPLFSYVPNDAHADLDNSGIHGSAATTGAVLSIYFLAPVLAVQGDLNWTSSVGTGWVYAIPAGTLNIVDIPSGQFSIAPGSTFNQLDVFFADTQAELISDVSFSLTQLSYDQPNAPEPATMSLFGVGLLSLGFLRFRKARS